MDGRKNNGAKGYQGQGRKPKAEETKLIEKLSPYNDLAINLLVEKLREKDMNALKMFMEYMHGKPRQSIESDTNITINDFDLREHLGFKDGSTT